MDNLLIDGRSLDIDAVARVARDAENVFLHPEARVRMDLSASWVAQVARGEMVDETGSPLAVYGVNTGYGSLARVRIPLEHIHALSMNLIRSHAAGVGPPLSADVVRATMLLRANALSFGASGCRPILVETLCEMLNRGVVPELPSQGSCGSSGDLSPLAHLGLVLFEDEASDARNSGFAWFSGERLAGVEAMRRAHIARLAPEPKEGLAVTNGAQVTTALFSLSCFDAGRLVLAAEIAAAMSLEALRGVSRALSDDVQRLRPYAGAIACAANLRTLTSGSTLIDSIPGKVQDAYALRCTPQILGAVRDGVAFARSQCEIELNAVTDNPVILLEHTGPNKAFSAGLFHGEPVGMAADHLKLAMCELASLSERRIFRLTTGALSARLPPLLVEKDRAGMGLMTPQTIAAALVSENKARAWPATADSIPTCEDQEDHVAMSTTAARRAAEVVENARRVVAIELLSAASALWWRQTESTGIRLGIGTQAALQAIENVVGGEQLMELPATHIERLATAIRDGSLLATVQSRTGALHGVGDA